MANVKNTQNFSRGLEAAMLTTVAELKDKILSLAVSSPKPCSIAIRRLLNCSHGLDVFKRVCQAIGTEYARHVFDTVSPLQWKEISRLDLTPIATGLPEALLELYTMISTEVKLWNAEEDIAAALSDVAHLKHTQRTNLLAKADPARVALLSLYWTPEEMSKILNSLEPASKREVVLRISRLDRLPENVIRQSALSCARWIHEQSQRPIIPPPFEKFSSSVSPRASPLDNAIQTLSNRFSNEQERQKKLLGFLKRESPVLYDAVGATAATEVSESHVADLPTSHPRNGVRDP